MYNIPEEVTKTFEKYLSCFDQETGEQVVEDDVVESLKKELEELQNKQGELQEWSLKKYREKRDSLELIDKEIERLKDLKEKEKKELERLESLVFRFCEKPWLYGLYKVTYRKSKRVIIADESLLPENVFVEKITKSASKTLISEAIERGEQVNGAYIENNTSLSVK